MKGRIITIVLLLSFVSSNAQFYKRVLVSESFVPTSIGAGATEILPGANTFDFSNTAGVPDPNDGMAFHPLDFDFNFFGTTFLAGPTFIGVSVNGYIIFTNTNTNASKILVNDNSTLYTAAPPGNVIAPYFDDLHITGDGLTGQVFYQTTGAVGSRIHTIQWQNMPSFSSGNVAGLNFGIRLFEGTNNIDFLRGPVVPGLTPGGSSSESASSGMQISPTNDFYDLWTGSSKLTNGMVNSNRWGDYGSVHLEPGIPPPVPAGTYIIPGDYFNFTEWEATVNAAGVSGPVIAQVNNFGTGNVTPFSFGPVPGTSAINTITIRTATSPARVLTSYPKATAGFWGTNQFPTINSFNIEPFIGLIGSDNFIIQDLEYFPPNPAEALPRGISIFNYSGTDGATNNTIANNKITLNNSNPNSLGISFNSLTPATNASGTNSDNKIYNNILNNMFAGAIIFGSPLFPDNGNILQGNTFGANYAGTVTGDIGGGLPGFTSGIQMSNQRNFIIQRNILQNLGNTGAPMAGIYVDNCTGANHIRANSLRGFRDFSTTIPGPKHFIVLFLNPVGSNQISVTNNMISDFFSDYSGAATTARQATAIFTGGGNSNLYDIWFNSVVMNLNAPNVSNTIIDISDNNPTINLWGNSFINSTPNQAGPATHSIIQTTNLNNFGSPTSVSNYNNFFIQNPANGPIAITNTTQRPTMANWIAAMTGNPGSDANSITQDPLFFGPKDLHIQVGSPVINTAIPGATGVTSDFDGQLRPNGVNFDMGADEFYSTLPAEMILFAGQKTTVGNLLKWTTVTESNNHGFDVQRSIDGRNFLSIGFVSTIAQGGNHDGELNYSFIDPAPQGLKQFYRLKQTDINGRIKFSSIVLIRHDKPDHITIDGMFPNPVNDRLNVRIQSPIKNQVNLVVCDLAGRIILQRKANVEAGFNTLDLNMGGLRPGYYFLKLAGGSKEENGGVRFLKL